MVSQELRFEHLVMRCQGCYEFGALARAQLRMDNDTLTASVDGVMYEPFKETAMAVAGTNGTILGWTSIHLPPILMLWLLSIPFWDPILG